MGRKVSRWVDRELPCPVSGVWRPTSAAAASPGPTLLSGRVPGAKPNTLMPVCARLPGWMRLPACRCRHQIDTRASTSPSPNVARHPMVIARTSKSETCPSDSGSRLQARNNHPGVGMRVYVICAHVTRCVHVHSHAYTGYTYTYTCACTCVYTYTCTCTGTCDAYTLKLHVHVCICVSPLSKMGAGLCAGRSSAGTAGARHGTNAVRCGPLCIGGAAEIRARADARIDG